VVVAKLLGRPKLADPLATQLGLAADDDTNRRVRAVLTCLGAAGAS
jgi:hypothetical protein